MIIEQVGMHYSLFLSRTKIIDEEEELLINFSSTDRKVNILLN